MIPYDTIDAHGKKMSPFEVTALQNSARVVSIRKRKPVKNRRNGNA